MVERKDLDVFLPLHIVPNIALYRLGILKHANTTRLLPPDARVHDCYDASVRYNHIRS